MESKNFEIYIVNDNSLKKIFNFNSSNNETKIIINIYNQSNFKITKAINKIKNLFNIYDDTLKEINITFQSDIDVIKINFMITKLNDILYSYYPITKKINILNAPPESIYLMNELIKYKNLVMEPNLHPDNYIEYIKQNIPSNYNYIIYNVNENIKFPLTKSVGSASYHQSYFVHIKPEKMNDQNKNIYLVGKGVTYDTGGLNLKTSFMEDMKVDMTGSAIVFSVLKLLNYTKYDEKYNIHLILPIVENMIGGRATKPGTVITSNNGKKIEIINTDAEGRLTFVDAFEFIYLELINYDYQNIIIDIATLTGNTIQITSGISSLSMCNKEGLPYVKKLINIGEKIGEYVDYLKIRKEYLEMLKSNVADIKNIDTNIKAGCVMAGYFLSYFIEQKIPWIHIDVGVSTFVNSMCISYGVNLLFQFIKEL